MKINAPAVHTFRQAELFVVLVVYYDLFRIGIEALQTGTLVPSSSSINDLDPCFDDDGMLWVVGRLRRSVNPLIIPKGSHIAELLVAHFNREVKHHGRLLTEGAIRTAGYWVIGCRRRIISHIWNCVTCWKLRGRQQQPQRLYIYAKLRTVACMASL